MGFTFGKRSRSALATCHQALQTVADRALELSPIDFTVTAGTGSCLTVAPYPASLAASKFQAIAGAFRQAAQEKGIVIRWSGDFHFFADLTRFEIDEPADGQSLVLPSVPATELVATGKTDGSSLTPALRAEYESLFARAAIRPERQAIVSATAQRMADADHWPRYVAVADSIGVPPHLVALIHAMESGLDFSRHLHNGDSLETRTVHVPAGRPLVGKPPFSWEESACDALILRKLDAWSDWSLAGLAYVLERYNGLGYRQHHPDVPTPYLWSFTTAYTRGKYTSDGHFDPQAQSAQAGAMALLRGLVGCGKAYPWWPDGDA